MVSRQRRPETPHGGIRDVHVCDGRRYAHPRAERLRVSALHLPRADVSKYALVHLLPGGPGEWGPGAPGPRRVPAQLHTRSRAGANAIRITRSAGIAADNRMHAAPEAERTGSGKRVAGGPALRMEPDE